MAMIVTRTCPGCQRYVLKPVPGGLGKMGRCVKCGWTGPMQAEPERVPWEPLRLVAETELEEDFEPLIAGELGRIK